MDKREAILVGPVTLRHKVLGELHRKIQIHLLKQNMRQYVLNNNAKLNTQRRK